MAHSHNQVIGTPFVPPSVTFRLICMKEVFERSGKCSLCEIQSQDILVSETRNFSANGPFASIYPFETWITPLQHSSYLHEIDQDKVSYLGSLLRSMLQKLYKYLNDSSFNYTIHGAVWTIIFVPTLNTLIVPQLSVTGGFGM
uniref:Uncharacterized protein n=3 Tax=Avena sativa TaxID=4498 RepID=A0ACD5TU76_AVESA